MSDTPSSRIVSSANAVVDVKTENGRVLKVRRLKALDRARLFKAIGAAQSPNAPYFGYAILAASVVQIDDLPMPFPTKDAQIEAAIDRLDDDGLDAVALHFATVDSDPIASDAEPAA
jgi:hypothetical protein